MASEPNRGVLNTPSPVELVVCQDGTVYGWTAHSDEWVPLGNAGETAAQTVMDLIERAEASDNVLDSLLTCPTGDHPWWCERCEEWHGCNHKCSAEQGVEGEGRE